MAFDDSDHGTRPLAHPMYFREMRRDPGAKQLDQGWIHEPVVVGDAQTDDVFAGEMLLESRRELGLVLGLHDEDEIGPFDKLAGERRVRVVAEPGRCTLDAGMLAEHLFGRWTPPFVLATDEEHAGHADTLSRSSSQQEQGAPFDRVAKPP